MGIARVGAARVAGRQPGLAGNTPTSRTCRALLRTITVVVALATSVVLLAGCGIGARSMSGATSGGVGPSTMPTPSSTSEGVAPARVVMIIRHGEKPDGSHPGLDASGNLDDSSLTEVGWNRAHRLVDLFDPLQDPLRRGLSRPKAIYAAAANNNGEGQRTRETVAPLADKLGIPVNTSFGKGDEKKLVKQVVTQPGPALIAWQHGEIPTIAAAFPSVTPTPPSQWPDDRFDMVWTLTQTADGWHFAQLPELVLPQDRAGVVGN